MVLHLDLKGTQDGNYSGVLTVSNWIECAE